MGSCVSVHKDQESVKKLRQSLGPKNEKTVIAGGDPMVANAAVKSHHPISTSPDAAAGSKEETFFDSQPWLESDCDDDFSSVNGDFPSQGTTPAHDNFSVENRDSLPKSVKADKKKKLSELFEERLRADLDLDQQNATDSQNGDAVKVASEVSGFVHPPISHEETPCGERTSSGVSGPQVESVNSAQRCLPKFTSSRSYSERKKWMSPAHPIRQEMSRARSLGFSCMVKA